MNERTERLTQSTHPTRTNQTPRTSRAKADAKRPIGAKLTVAVIVLAALMFCFSTRRPPEMVEV